MSYKWEYRPLSDIAEINPRRPIKKGEVTPFIDMAALPIHSRDVDGNIPSREYKAGGSKFRNGDTLVARITPCLENGKTAFVNCLPDNTVAHGSTEFIVLAPRSKHDAVFVYYLARSGAFRDYAIARMEGTSGRQRVPNSAVASYKFPCPPTDQRVGIGKLLSSLDDRITLLRETNKTLEDIAQAIFKSWFVDFDPVRAKMEGRQPEGMDGETAELFPGSFEESELGVIPSGWNVVTIQGVCDTISNGSTPSRSKEEYWNFGTIPWVKTGELADGFLISSAEQITEKALVETSVKLLPENSILMAIYAAPTVGRLGVLTQPATFNQACTGLVAKKHVGTWFLFWTLFFARGWFNSRANGAAQQNISKKIVENFELVLPSSQALSAFGEVSSRLHEKIRANTETISTLSSLRDTLLPRLISGQLRLPEAQEITEAVLS